MTERNKNVLVLPGAFDYDIAAMFSEYGFRPVQKLDDAGVVVYTGGEDVNPALYGEEPHRSVYFSKDRDDMEVGVYNEAKDVLHVGICRGAQLLNVLAGGKLWQDVDGHGRSHTMSLVEHEGSIRVTSLHHQVMRMAPGAVFMGYGQQATRFINADGVFHRKEGGEPLIEVEACAYPKLNMLCYQPHPEIAETGSPCVTWFFDRINDMQAGKTLPGRLVE